MLIICVLKQKYKYVTMAVIIHEDEEKIENEDLSDIENIGPPRYIYTLRNKFICMGYKTIDDFKQVYEDHAKLMELWKNDGIELDPHGVDDDYATFYTYDPEVAQQYGFELEEIEQY